MGCGASRVQPDQAVLIAEAAAAEAAAAERAAPEKTVVEKAAAEFERQLAMARAAQEAPTNAALRFGQQFELITLAPARRRLGSNDLDDATKQALRAAARSGLELYL